jgi:hypothetical protein
LENNLNNKKGEQMETEIEMICKYCGRSYGSSGIVSMREYFPPVLACRRCAGRDYWERDLSGRLIEPKEGEKDAKVGSALCGNSILRCGS